MNSALKPVLTPSTGPQTTSVPTQINNKQMHPQSAPSSTTYGQQSTTTAVTTQQHTPQSLVNLPHNNNSNNNNPNVAHNNQQLLPNPAHQTNHYSLTIPNAPQHYTNNTQIPASNHPVPNISQTSASNSGGQTPYTTQHTKNTSYPSGYQPNLGHPPNPIPPVTQALPATPSPLSQQQSSTSPTTTTTTESLVDKPQSNGTTEEKSPIKSEPVTSQQQENHVTTSPKDKTPVTSPTPPQSIEKTPTTTTTTENVPEQKENENSDKINETATLPQSNSEPVKTSIEDKTEPPIENNEIKPETNDKNEDKTDDSLRENNEENAVETTTTTKPKEQQKNSPVAKQSPTTPRTPPTIRKSRTPKSDNESPPARSVKNDSKITTPTTTTQQKSPSGIGKSKRTRTRTQPYQSPLPEIEIITKITSTPKPKNNDDKLIVFYKNEFLAVRNSEGSFYICQAVQNIYKSSPKIRIRWLSQDKNDKTGEVYTPDFYDHTDFDCILTNLNLERVDKGKYRLPPAEKERTDSILKRSLAVEKGEVTSPSLTEEHPDGIDVSLYKEESQLKKRKGKKRRSASALKTDKADTSSSTSTTSKSPDQSKVRKVVTKTNKRSVRKRSITARKTASISENRKTTVMPTTTTTTSRTDRLKRRSDNQNNNKVSPIVDQKKARVLAKVVRKSAVTTNKNQTESVKTPKPSSSKVQKPTIKATTKKARETKRSKK